MRQLRCEFVFITARGTLDFTFSSHRLRNVYEINKSLFSTRTLENNIKRAVRPKLKPTLYLKNVVAGASNCNCVKEKQNNVQVADLLIVLTGIIVFK